MEIFYMEIIICLLCFILMAEKISTFPSRSPLTVQRAWKRIKQTKKKQNNNKTTKQKMLFWLSSIYPLLHFFPLHTYHKRKNVCSRIEPPIISPAALRWYILWTVQIPQHRIREIFFSRNWKRGQVQIDTKFVDHNRSY